MALEPFVYQGIGLRYPAKNVDIIKIEPDEIFFVLKDKEKSNSTQK